MVTNVNRDAVRSWKKPEHPSGLAGGVGGEGALWGSGGLGASGGSVSRAKQLAASSSSDDDAPSPPCPSPRAETEPPLHITDFSKCEVGGGGGRWAGPACLPSGGSPPPAPSHARLPGFLAACMLAGWRSHALAQTLANTTHPTPYKHPPSQVDRSTLALMYSPNLLSWVMAGTVDYHVSMGRHFAYPHTTLDGGWVGGWVGGLLRGRRGVLLLPCVGVWGGASPAPAPTHTPPTHTRAAPPCRRRSAGRVPRCVCALVASGQPPPPPVLQQPQLQRHCVPQARARMRVCVLAWGRASGALTRASRPPPPPPPPLPRRIKNFRKLANTDWALYQASSARSLCEAPRPAASRRAPPRLVRAPRHAPNHTLSLAACRGSTAPTHGVPP